MTHRFLIAACFAAAVAVPALAQSNSANEGAASPDGTQAAPMMPAPAQDRQQAQRQANSDPYNMPQNRAAVSAQASDPAAARNDATKDNSVPADADTASPAR